MTVQHNLPALNSQRQLGINNRLTAKNLEKLSSGYRINRAGDDAAGLAISEKMRGQIRGLEMAAQNSENGVSLIQTAEGGLNEAHAVLQRMRELAVQSSNGTFTDDDREQIGLEFQALKREIDRISSSTHYNGIKLLDGTLGGSSPVDLPGNGTTTSDGSMSALANKMYDMGFRVFTTTPINETTIDCTVELTTYDSSFNGKAAALITTSGTDVNGYAQIALQVGDETFVGDWKASGSFNGVDGTTINITASRGAYIFFNEDGQAVATFRVLEGSSPSRFLIDDASSGVISGINLADNGTVTQLLTSTTPMNSQGTVPVPANHPLYNATLATSKDSLTFQIGANGGADQKVGLYVKNMSTANLGDRVENRPINPSGTVADAKVNPLLYANAAIDVLDAAISQVSSTRADLGALQNRLEHTLNNLGVTRENLQAAESTIRDVDMAKEMMEFTKNNILTQASQSMLAQANQLPQGILTMLR